jgi:tRNA(Ile)-lysidine synthetase-like protein
LPVKGCGFILEVRADEIILSERLAHTPKKGYFFTIPHAGSRGLFEGLEFELFESKNRETGPDLASFSFPIVLRSVRPADKLAIRGGTKLVNDLFGEWGVPEHERTAIPLLEDGLGLICVLGSPLGYRNRFAERGYTAASSDARYLTLKVTAKGGLNGR